MIFSPISLKLFPKIRIESYKYEIFRRVYL